MVANTQAPITKVRGGWVAVWDSTGQPPRHRVVERGEVAFQGDRILYAGPRYEGHADQAIDRPDWFICPGFINLHGHVGLEVMSSLIDLPPGRGVGPSESFVKDSPVFMPPTLSLEEQRLSAEFSLVQMLRTGTTTVVDAHGYGPVWWLGNPPTDEEMLSETVGRIGSRAYLALGFRSARSFARADGSRGYHWDEGLGRAGLEEGLRFAQNHDGAHDGRVRGLLTPHHAFICSPELLQETRAAARRHGLWIQVHVAEWIPEIEIARDRYGETPVGLLHQIGFLGPDIILGHCVYTSGHPDVGGDPDRDLGFIADAGSSVAHSPRLFFASGRALHSLSRYLDHGVNVGIGCDIWPSDIIEEMRLAWFMGKQTAKTAARPTCHEVFAAATVGSADALGRQDLGRLTAGAQADLVCVDVGRYHYGPVLDPVRSLVLFGRGQDVETVFVAGQRVVENGRVLNADEDLLQAAAPGIHRSLATAVARRDPLGRTPEDLLGMENSTGGMDNV